MITHLTAILLLAFAGCDECHNLPFGIDCTGDGRCWVQMPDWEQAAQWSDPDDIQDGIDSGTLVLDPISKYATCYSYSPGAHTCVLELDCYDLSVRPADELEFVGHCAVDFEGDWDHVEATSTACYGIFDGPGLAVRLRPAF